MDVRVALGGDRCGKRQLDHRARRIDARSDVLAVDAGVAQLQRAVEAGHRVEDHARERHAVEVVEAHVLRGLNGGGVVVDGCLQAVLRPGRCRSRRDGRLRQGGSNARQQQQRRPEPDQHQPRHATRSIGSRLTAEAKCGGDDRIRTGDRGFADRCLATWLRRRMACDFSGWVAMIRAVSDRATRYGMILLDGRADDSARPGRAHRLPLARRDARVRPLARHSALDDLRRPRRLVAGLYARRADQPAPAAQGARRHLAPLA